MNARGIGGIVVGLIGIAMIVAAMGSQTCRWVAPGADVRATIEKADTVYTPGDEFKCIKKVDGGGGLFLLGIGIAGIVGGVYLLVKATKDARANDVRVRTETGMAGSSAGDTRIRPPEPR